VTVCVTRAGGEGVHAGERHFLDRYNCSGLPKILYGNPKWHELSELVTIQRLQEQPSPQNAERKKKRKEETQYISWPPTAPSPNFAARNGYIPSQKNAKPTPLWVEVLTHTRYPSL
jgi:hypothetical protein